MPALRKHLKLIIAIWQFSLVAALGLTGAACVMQPSLAPASPLTAAPTSPAEVGRAIFFDATLSSPAGTSCASCHDPARAFSGDNGSGLPVARGAKPGALGQRNAPSLMYLRDGPPFRLREVEGKLIPSGGFNWDGSRDTLALQALGPFFHPAEMGNRDAAELAQKLRRSPSADALKKLSGIASSGIDAQWVNAATQSLEAFLQTATFAPFTSKFDAVQRGQARFTEQEQRGQSLFQIRQKGNCVACHAMNPDSKRPEDSLFTNFEHHAIGGPRNRRLTPNAKADHFDLGICQARPELTAHCGKFKTPSLRNVARTAPYMHNGVFTHLRDAVAFYATRDTAPEKWYPGGVKFDDLPPALHGNVDQDTPPYNRHGKRAQLNDEEIDDIVAFLHTLSDGFRKPD